MVAEVIRAGNRHGGGDGGGGSRGLGHSARIAYFSSLELTYGQNRRHLRAKAQFRRARFNVVVMMVVAVPDASAKVAYLSTLELIYGQNTRNLRATV